MDVSATILSILKIANLSNEKIGLIMDIVNETITSAPASGTSGTPASGTPASGTSGTPASGTLASEKSIDEQITDAEAAVLAAKTALDAAKAAFETAETALDAAKAAFETAETNFKAADTAIEVANSACDETSLNQKKQDLSNASQQVSKLELEKANVQAKIDVLDVSITDKSRKLLDIFPELNLIDTAIKAIDLKLSKAKTAETTALEVVELTKNAIEKNTIEKNNAEAEALKAIKTAKDNAVAAQKVSDEARTAKLEANAKLIEANNKVRNLKDKKSSK